MSAYVEQAKVYRNPFTRRRYLSKKGAIHSVARHLIYERHPIEKPEFDNIGLTYPGYDIKIDDPAYYEKMFRRIVRLINRCGIFND